MRSKKAAADAGSIPYYEREAQEGRKIRNYFCPTCGTTVYWELDRLPTLYGIAAASFEEKPSPLAGRSLWEENMCEWVVVPHGMERLQKATLRGEPIFAGASCNDQDAPKD
jgi:hypothetical protein